MSKWAFLRVDSLREVLSTGGNGHSSQISLHSKKRFVIFDAIRDPGAPVVLHQRKTFGGQLHPSIDVCIAASVNETRQFCPRMGEMAMATTNSGEPSVLLRRDHSF